MIMPPAATLNVTGNLAEIPEATVSWLNSELPRFPPRAALSQFQVLREETLVQVQLCRDFGDLRRCGVGAPGQGHGRVARNDQDERIDAEGDEEQEQHGDEQPTCDKRRREPHWTPFRGRGQSDPVRRRTVGSLRSRDPCRRLLLDVDAGQVRRHCPIGATTFPRPCLVVGHNRWQ